MTISIIIPTFNEEQKIGSLLNYLDENRNGVDLDFIVSDCGSTDRTIKIASEFGARVIQSQKKGRAQQMNLAAKNAHGSIFYFLHADTLPPKSYSLDIIKAVNKGFKFGRYQTKFDSKLWILKVNAYFTRFNWYVSNGGDQTLFITKEFFNTIGGYNEHLVVMEDYEIVKEANKLGKIKIFDKKALISTRKYDDNSWLKVQIVHTKVINMFKKGKSQDEIVDYYKSSLVNIR